MTSSATSRLRLDFHHIKVDLKKIRNHSTKSFIQRMYVHSAEQVRDNQQLAVHKRFEYTTYSSLNMSKTVGMYFSIKKADERCPDILVKGEVINFVEHFKYLGMIMDSNLNFKKHIKKVSKSTRASLMIFINIRHQLPVAAAKLFMHTMILPHLSYCATSWSHTSITTLKPLYTIYKQAVKILAKKPRSYHHCNIIKNYKLLTFDNFLFFADVCLMYKLFHDLAPPPLKQCVTFCKDNIRQTRSSVRGDCSTKFKKT